MPSINISEQTRDDVREEYVESVATGVEVEDQLPSDEPEPWDPEKIRIHTKHYSLRQVVEMIADGDIDLDPDFQRNYVWKARQRWGLIESLLLGIPLPSFYFNEDASGRLQVVDGVQRLTTIFRYVEEQSFKLGKVTYLQEFEGQGFDDLAAPFRRRLNSAQFVAHVIDPQTPYRVKFDIFRRINTGGSPLSAQEIRHCMSKNRSRGIPERIGKRPEFPVCDGWSSRESSTDGRSRGCIAVRRIPLVYPDDYAEHGSFDEFLGFVTEQLDDPANHSLGQLRIDFVRGMTNAYAVFGDHAFRKWPVDATRRNPINRALFESWGTALAGHDENTVSSVASDLVDRARGMMTNDQEFINAISGSTGDIRNVRTRFGKVREVLEEALR